MGRDDADPSKWDCPPHTRAKLDLLGRYLDGWFPILASWNGRVLFLDGFAGRGRYNDGSEGSPLIALRRLLDRRSFPQMRDREFIFFFVEANRDNATSLQKEVDAFRAARTPWPSTVKYQVINTKFDVTASALLEHLREQKRQLAPSFIFVDPFRYSGLPMDLLAELLAYPRTELFVNFMVGHVQRFITRSGQENVVRELFGIDVRDVLEGHRDPADRVEHLRQAYIRQLHERVGFKYVQSFAMLNQTGNVSYYLIHGTRHEKGLELMKHAMWKIDPGGEYTFSDRLAGENVLFTLEPNLRPLRDDLLRHYAARQNVTVPEIERHVLLDTPYLDTHIRKVLRPLERDQRIRVNRPPGRRQFAAGVTIDFP